MTAPISGTSIPRPEGEDLSLFAVANTVLRRRRLIATLVMGGGILGLLAGLLPARTYVSSATFIPQSSEGTQTGLALEANRFGIRVPSSVGGWGAPIYVNLLQSPQVLQVIASDTVAIDEEGGRRVPLSDLLGVHDNDRARLIDQTVRQLQTIATANEAKSIGAVRLTVETKWPSVSLWLADRLVEGVHQFYLRSRNSQASEERKFVEQQATEAQKILRESEDHLQSFLEKNRIVGSPELSIERERLARDVALKQTTLSTLLQNREEARIREVRDTPVITIIESPKLAAVPEPRNAILKAILGGMLGGIIGAVISYVANGIANARRSTNPETAAFFGLVEEVTPKFLRKRLR